MAKPSKKPVGLTKDEVSASACLGGLRLGFLPFRILRWAIERTEPSARASTITASSGSILAEMRSASLRLGLPPSAQPFLEHLANEATAICELAESEDFQQRNENAYLLFGFQRADCSDEEVWPVDHECYEQYWSVHPELDPTQRDRRIARITQVYKEYKRQGPKKWEIRRFPHRCQSEILIYLRRVWIGQWIKENISFGSLVEALAGIRGQCPQPVANWLEIGEVLGRAWWQCWCPSPQVFDAYVPRALTTVFDLLSKLPTPKALQPLPTREDLLDQWKKCRIIEPPTPEASLDELPPASQPEWAEFLAERCETWLRDLEGHLVSAAATLASGSGKDDVRKPGKQPMTASCLTECQRHYQEWTVFHQKWKTAKTKGSARLAFANSENMTQAKSDAMIRSGTPKKKTKK